jgi:hypothetical protein
LKQKKYKKWQESSTSSISETESNSVEEEEVYKPPVKPHKHRKSLIFEKND